MSEQIVPEALKWIQFAGLDVNKEKIHVRSNVMIALTIPLYILQCLLIGFHIGEIDVWVSVLEVMSPVLLSTLKLLTLYFGLKNFKKINQTVEALWPTSKFGPEFGSTLESTFNLMRSLLSGNRWFVVLTTGLIVPLKPIFAGGLPVDIWQPFDLFVSPYYELAYAWGTACSYYAVITNVGIHSLLMGYVTHMVCQFRMLQYALTHLLEDIQEEDKCMEILKSYVNYHNHLLSLINNIQASFSAFLTCMVGIVTISICVDLFSVTYDEGALSLSRIVKYAFQFSCFLFYLFSYCFASEHLTYQSFRVAQAAYVSKWYLAPYPKVRSALRLIIQRSQKVVSLTGGGIVKLNLESYIRMLQLAFSFFTLIRTKSGNNKYLKL